MTAMSGTWCGRLLPGAAVLGIVVACSASATGLLQEPWAGVLDEHPSIQYAIRPTTDHVAKLNQELTERGRSLRRDARTGYLLPLLEALGVPVESQVLVFSKTGVQRAYTSPEQPARPLLRRVCRRRLHPGRSPHRVRGPRSSTRRGVLHPRPGGGCAGPRTPDELSRLSCVGEHAQRAGNNRAQPHRW